MSNILLLVAVIFLAGCATAEPYAEIGIGYQINTRTDWYLDTHREWQCSTQPKIHLEVGLETENNWKIGYHHQSWLACGGPFNSHPELYQEEIRITKKFGGQSW